MDSYLGPDWVFWEARTQIPTDTFPKMNMSKGGHFHTEIVFQARFFKRYVFFWWRDFTMCSVVS